MLACRDRALLVRLGLVLWALTGCGGPQSASEDPGSTESVQEQASQEPLVVYSGRNKSLIEPLLERFQSAGRKLEVRYGETAELVATLLEEGERTPCDVFIAQDAAALGMLSRTGMLRALPDDLLGRLPVSFASPQGDWIGLSGRARVVVYNTESVGPEDLPQTLDEVTAPRFRGRFGLAPGNASFQAHMAVYRAVHGPEALAKLLAGMAANEPKRYPKNSPIVEAAIQGEIDWGLVNHYYLWRALAENPEATAANAFMVGDEVSGFINLAGVGALSDRPQAIELVRFLVSDEAQEYFAEETFEYPVVAGVESAIELESLPPNTGQFDFAQVSDNLEATLAAIGASGLLQ